MTCIHCSSTPSCVDGSPSRTCVDTPRDLERVKENIRRAIADYQRRQRQRARK